MTYQQAHATIPASAQWSSSFGNPGEGGYSEFWRDQDGVRYEISNGKWCDGGDEWSARRVGA